MEVHELFVLNVVHRHRGGAKLGLDWLDTAQVIVCVVNLCAKVATVECQICSHLHLCSVDLTRFVQIRYLHYAGQICVARAQQVMMMLRRMLFG